MKYKNNFWFCAIFACFWIFVPLVNFAQTPVAFKESLEAKVLLAPEGTRFYFDIIESCDAKYLGDTPSHRGKHGGLTLRPKLAVGDLVYRTIEEKDEVIGVITQAVWERTSGGLSVEFSPEPLKRICVGEEVWVDINPSQKK